MKPLRIRVDRIVDFAANVAHLGPGVKGRGLVVRSRTEGPLRDSSGEPGCDTAPAALVMFAPDTVCAGYRGPARR